MQQLIKALTKAVINKWVWFMGGMLVAGLVIPLVMYGGFRWIYRDKVFPSIKMGGVLVAGLREEEVVHMATVLEKDFLSQEKIDVLIRPSVEASAEAGLRVEVGLDDLSVEYDTLETARRTMAIGRSGDWQDDLKTQWQGLQTVRTVGHMLIWDDVAVHKLVEGIAEQVNDLGVPAGLKVVEGFDGEKQVEVFLGEDGLGLDQTELVTMLEESLIVLNSEVIDVALTQQDNHISEVEAATAQARAERLLTENLTVKAADLDKWQVGGEELIRWLDVTGGYNLEQIEVYVAGLAEAVDREPQNALFKFKEGRVLEFAPGLNGLVVEQERSVEALVEAVEEMEESYKLPVIDDQRLDLIDTDGQQLIADNQQSDVVVELVIEEAAPELATPDVNDLGIHELIGHGQSTYFHSIPGRVHNVALTASKLNGVLIPPGEVFSFNETIGDISRATGYQAAYIIKNGRTELGDGGGVCQDSTTMFRSVLDAGLPIVERKAHAYRVGYYEQNSEPGFDATVYAPNPDLKFENDTGAYILIQATADTSALSLEIDLYGTDDGRVAEISNYQKWGYAPAPPPLYQDDPTLEPGVVKQIDWAASGLKTKFDYTVTRDGETLFEKTFYSSYKPWQAIYLRGV